jgi:hypothetical protein
MNKSRFTFMLLLVVAMFSTNIAFAQTGDVIAVSRHHPPPTGKKEEVPKGRGNTLLYIGSGYNFLNSNTKSQAYLNDAIGVNASIYQPLVVRKVFTFGIHIGAEYGFSLKNNFPALPSAFHVIGETSSTVAYNSNAGSIKQSAFKIEVGPQLNIHIGNHFVISPAFLVGGMVLSQNEITADQTTIANNILGSQTYHYTLLRKLDMTAGALALTPKIRFHYLINNWIGLWAEVNYTIAPTIKTYLSKFTPQDTPDSTGYYDRYQLDHGTTTTEQRKFQYASIGVNGGLVFSFGRKKEKVSADPYVGEVTSHKQPPPAVDTKDKTKEPIVARELKRPKTALSPPEIISPKNYDVITPTKDRYSFDISNLRECNTEYRLTIKDDKGKEVWDQLYSNKWDGDIPAKAMKKEGSQYIVQVQAITRMGAGCPAPQKDLGKLKEITEPVYSNDGKSQTVVVNTQKSMCLPPQNIVDVTLDSAVCYKGDTVKVYAHSSINNSGGFSVVNLQITGIQDIQTGSPANVSLSLPYLPSTMANTNFTFLTTAQCKPIKLLYSAVVSSSNCELPFNCHTDSLLLPCCVCNYCNTPAGNTIEVANNTISVNADGTATVVQNFNISKRIGKVTAEVIYDANTVNNEVCRICADGAKPNYNFNANDGMVWSGAGNSGSNVPANASNSTNQFPSKVITWPCNNSGHVQLTSQIYLPPLAALGCCAMSSQVCIRYSFTDTECHTCEEVVCYTIYSTGPMNY